MEKAYLIFGHNEQSDGAHINLLDDTENKDEENSMRLNEDHVINNVARFVLVQPILNGTSPHENKL